MTDAKRALPYWLAYALLWAGAVGYLAATGGDWASPIMSLLLVVPLHSAIDLLPNLPRFLEHFAA